MRLGHEWAGTVAAVGAGVDAGLAGPARHRRHDARLRALPPVPERPPARVPRPLRDRHPRRLAGCAGRAGAGAGHAPLRAAGHGRRGRRRAGRAGRQRAARAVRATEAAPGARVLVLRAGHDRAARGAVRRRGGARGAPGGPVGALPRVRRSSAGDRPGLGRDELPDLPYDAVIDCTPRRRDPGARRWRASQPGGRSCCIGLSGAPSTVDTRDLVLKDVTAVGILSASPGLADTIEHYADGRVDPRPLVAGTIGLAEVGDGPRRRRRCPASAPAPRSTSTRAADHDPRRSSDDRLRRPGRAGDRRRERHRRGDRAAARRRAARRWRCSTATPGDPACRRAARWRATSPTPTAVAAAVDAVAERFGRLDVVVNNAGIGRRRGRRGQRRRRVAAGVRRERARASPG